jgi:hypothetical protein
LKEVGDDSMRYGGFVDKATRRKMKEQALAKSKVVETNPE